jgi:hypothetical protein
MNYSGTVCEINGQMVPCGDISPAIMAAVAGFQLVFLAIGVIVLISLWKLFVKAGQPGWAVLIPIYNIIVMLQIIKKPIWWIILMLIPFVNIIMMFVVSYNFAKVFGKGTGFMLGMIFLPFIFYPILGFGKSVYTAPVNA